MKVIVPIKKTDNKLEINDTFGRAESFYLRDLEGDEYEIIENPGASSTGGAGIKTAEFVLGLNPDLILSPRCGEKARKLIDSMELKIYKTEGLDLEENIRLYLDGKLAVLD